MLKRHERFRNNSHEELCNGQSGLFEGSKSIKSESVALDGGTGAGDLKEGILVAPGLIGPKVNRLVQNYLVNRGFDPATEEIESSMPRNLSQSAQKLSRGDSESASTSKSRTVRATTTVAYERVIDEGWPQVTAQFAANVSKLFQRFIKFVGSIEDTHLSNESKKLLGPLLIWMSFDLLENGFSAEAIELLTTYMPTAVEAMDSQKTVEEIQSIANEIVSGLKIGKKDKQLCPLKLSACLFVSVSVKCRDLVTAYLKRTSNAALMLQTFNTFVTVDDDPVQPTTNEIETEVEETNGGEIVQPTLDTTATAESQEPINNDTQIQPKPSKKRRKSPISEVPVKKVRADEKDVRRADHSETQSTLKVQKPTPTVQEEDDSEQISIPGLDSLDHLPHILPTRVHRFHLTGATGDYNRACVSANGHWIGVGCENGTVEVWSGQKRSLQSSWCRQHSGNPLDDFTCSFSSSKASANDQRDADTPVVLRGHSGAVYSVQFLNGSHSTPSVYSDDNPTHLLSSGEDGTVRLFDVGRRQNVCAYVASAKGSCVWDLDTFGLEYFVTGGQDQTARLFQSERLYPLRVLAGHKDSVDCVQFHNTGKYVVSASSDGTARFWALNEAKPARLFHRGTESANIFCGTPMAVAFSADGRKVAVAHGTAQTVSVWDIGEQKLLQVIAQGFTGSVLEVSFICGDSVLATGSQDGVVQLWHLNKQSSGQTVDTVTQPTRTFGDNEDLTILSLKEVNPNRLVAVCADGVKN